MLYLQFPFLRPKFSSLARVRWAFQEEVLGGFFTRAACRTLRALFSFESE